MKIFIILLTIYLLSSCTPNNKNKTNSWTEYLGGPDRNHYSTLSDIDTTNVHQLKIAWTYETPDSGQMQMNPVMVNVITGRHWK